MDKQDQERRFDSYYDRAEYELTVSIRDLIETVARMDIVHRPGTDLYEISGIISQAIFKHSRVHPKQTNVRTLPWVPREVVCPVEMESQPFKCIPEALGEILELAEGLGWNANLYASWNANAADADEADAIEFLKALGYIDSRD